ncbi:MAG: class I SAM-dependent methyltransferase [Proteobacteria bacterium]|nr:class I SAM-dependent methyltransferase [Pseudomonadota bacterium]
MDSSAEQFYDSVSNEYTDFVVRCIPRYEEMLLSLFKYIPTSFSPRTILDLGCGTGNLTCLITKYYPEAKIIAVDISKECIDKCKKRTAHLKIQYIKEDFRKLTFRENSIDLIMSSIAIHHLDDEEKARFFKDVYKWQSYNGILSICDQFRGETSFVYEKHIELWKSFAYGQGATDKEWNLWMDHQATHDYHASLFNYMKWLRNTGYFNIDCTWRNLLWANLYAQKFKQK